MPLKHDDAYAAGIVDGEGCIRVGVKGVVRVHVTNTDPRLIAWLRERYGGYVWHEKTVYMPNARVRFVWEVSSIKAKEFLSKVIPYLVIKHDQASLALALQEMRSQRGKRVRTTEQLTAETALSDKIRALHHQEFVHVSA